jgi:hypothetical protein
MSAPRRLTPPSAQAGPRPRTPMSTLPWNLAEFNGPVSSPDAAGAGRAGGCTASELTALREQMQEQNVRAIAEARKAAFEEGRAAGRAEAQQAADRRVADAVAAVHSAAATIKHHEEHYAGMLEENLVALACGVARHIIEREVQVDPVPHPLARAGGDQRLPARDDVARAAQPDRPHAPQRRPELPRGHLGRRSADRARRLRGRRTRTHHRRPRRPRARAGLPSAHGRRRLNGPAAIAARHTLPSAAAH